jgi:hypothetical protein
MEDLSLRRAVDFERLAKLEVVQTQVTEDLRTVNQRIERMSDVTSRHLEKNNESFAEVGKSLALLASTVTDLKDTTKHLIEGQQKILGQISIIDNQNKQLEAVNAEVKIIKARVDLLATLETRLMASWKVFTVIASIVAFVISTSISVGVFKMGQSAPTAYVAKPAIEAQIERLIESQQALQPLKAK